MNALEPRTVFKSDEFGACIDCNEEHIQLIEFKPGGKHDGHHFYPNDAFLDAQTYMSEEIKIRQAYQSAIDLAKQNYLDAMRKLRWE